MMDGDGGDVRGERGPWPQGVHVGLGALTTGRPRVQKRGRIGCRRGIRVFGRGGGGSDGWGWVREERGREGGEDGRGCRD